MAAEATPGTYDDTYAGGNILEEATGEPKGFAEAAGGNILEEATGEPNVKGFAEAAGEPKKLEAAGEPKELDTTGVEGFGE
jgi:hypothetical protein